MTKRPDGSRMASTSHMTTREVAEYRNARAEKRWAGARSIHTIRRKPKTVEDLEAVVVAA